MKIFTIEDRLDYLFDRMKRCAEHIHPVNPIDYDIHFDSAMDLWAESQAEAIGWCSR